MGAEFVVDEGLELSAGDAFVAEDDLPGTHQSMVVFEQCLGGFPSAEFGAGPPMIGMPSAVQTRQSRKHQENREWLAQKP